MHLCSPVDLKHGVRRFRTPRALPAHQFLLLGRAPLRSFGAYTLSYANKHSGCKQFVLNIPQCTHLALLLSTIFSYV